MDAQKLIQDSVQFATNAVKADQQGDFTVAAFFYVEAAEALRNAISIDPSIAGSAKERALQYVERAEALKRDISQGKITLKRTISKTAIQKDVDSAEFLLKQALAEDEQNNHEKAIALYTDAVQMCLQISKGSEDTSLKDKLSKWARSALERAEDLKGVRPSQSKPNTSIPNTSIPQLSSNFGSLKIKTGAASSDGRPKLAQSELEVLAKTSKINGRVYPPWLDIDLNERFAYTIPFSDSNGFLALAPKQKKRFGEWARPSDLCQNPQMIYAVSSLSIRQTVVSDCSFVASLAISAAYERQFRKQLITGLIYPQDKHGKPMINPCGKYMVKLRINGVARKIIIDDTLPVGKDGELLCSYSNNSDEFWVSLLEKAYLKVMGGYDFPGSNSNIDLCALTGWIPERVSLKSAEVNKERLFDRMMEGLRRGDVLITVATGFIPDDDAERAGLVPTHAYAVLDIRKVQGLRLLQLKNPWNHLRWKGSFSENDTASWTRELQQALNYDRAKAVENDNGVFWINWDSLLHFYDVFYMNWNPRLFKYKFSFHAKWKSAEGPIKDSYNMGDNPQYRLDVHCGDEEGIVWILLTRHITERDDFADNKEFITVHVYKSNGDRIYYPDNPYLEGTKINSPHYLAKMRPSKGTSKYSLVISQYEKYHTIFYTLKVFGTVKFNLSPITDPYTSRKRITGQWTKSTAGGCGNNPTYKTNPVFILEIISNTPAVVLVKLEVSKQYAAGVELVAVDGGYKKSSGDYRWGFLVFELKDVPPGKYKVIPSTFKPGQEGSFFLEIAADQAINLNA